jgi:ketosteroid isomerase-like protein
MPLMNRRGWLIWSGLLGAASALGLAGAPRAGASAAPPAPSALPAAPDARRAPAGQAAKHPNVDLIERYYEAYGRNDLAALRDQFFAPDIRWQIPGHHPLAGTKQGLDEVVAFFAQLGRAGFKAQTIFLEANDEWVVDLHRGWSEAGPGLDQMWALAFRIRDGKIAEAVNYPGDQHAADAFFWAVYPLKPLPERLAT